MLKEITLPEDYTGTLEQENSVVEDINENFASVERMLEEKSESMNMENYVADFEEYSIDIYFANNKKKAEISVENEVITVTINEVEIRIDADGNIV